MKAPEKIYLDPALDALTKALSEKTEDDVEYTRTDVFIEKVYKWLNDNLAKYYELTNEDEYGNKLKETVMNVFYGQAVKDFQIYIKGE